MLASEWEEPFGGMQVTWGLVPSVVKFYDNKVGRYCGVKPVPWLISSVTTVSPSGVPSLGFSPEDGSLVGSSS